MRNHVVVGYLLTASLDSSRKSVHISNFRGDNHWQSNMSVSHLVHFGGNGFILMEDLLLSLSLLMMLHATCNAFSLVA